MKNLRLLILFVSFIYAENALASGQVIADFTLNSAVVDIDEAVSFTDNTLNQFSNSCPVNSWMWDFGADATPATSTEQNPSGITYSSSGMKSVTLTIAVPSNCGIYVNSNTATKIVTVNPPPIPTMSHWALMITALLLTSLAVVWIKKKSPVES